jgi:hypothetical protein
MRTPGNLRGIYRLILFEGIGALDSTLRNLFSPENGTFQEYLSSIPPLFYLLFPAFPILLLAATFARRYLA